jgi:hypothetical protein
MCFLILAKILVSVLNHQLLLHESTEERKGLSLLKFVGVVDIQRKLIMS